MQGVGHTAEITTDQIKLLVANAQARLASLAQSSSSSTDRRSAPRRLFSRLPGWKPQSLNAVCILWAGRVLGFLSPIGVVGMPGRS